MILPSCQHSDFVKSFFQTLYIYILYFGRDMFRFQLYYIFNYKRIFFKSILCGILFFFLPLFGNAFNAKVDSRSNNFYTITKTITCKPSGYLRRNGHDKLPSGTSCPHTRHTVPMRPSPHQFCELVGKLWQWASSTATRTASILPSNRRTPLPLHLPEVGRGRTRLVHQSRDRNKSIGRCRMESSSGLPDDDRASCTPGLTPSGPTYPEPLLSDPRWCR